MIHQSEGPDSNGIEPGPGTSAKQLSTPSAEPQNDNQSALRRRLKAAFAQAASESPEANIARQLQLLGHTRPFVLQAMIESTSLKDKRGEPLKLFKSALCCSASMALKLIRRLELGDDKVIGFFVVMNEVTAAHTAKLQLGKWLWCSKKRGTSTTDQDIEARLVLFIDFDPIRGITVSEDGEETRIESSSTAEQLKIALAAGLDCYELLHGTLIELGIDPSCMALAMSGNGVHVVIALDRIANTPEVTKLIRDLLNALAAIYDRAKVLDVDTGVFDSKRIAPAYGSMKRKGVHAAETPHRRTFITDGATTRLTLDELGRLHHRLCPPDAVQDILGGADDRAAPRSSAPRVQNLDGHSAYGAVMLERAVRRIADAPAGQVHNTIRAAAYLIGGLVAGGELVACLDELLPVCVCTDDKRTCEDGYRAGLEKPIAAPDRHDDVDDFDGLDEPEPEEPEPDAEPSSALAEALQTLVASPLALEPKPTGWKPLLPLTRAEEPLPLFPVDVLPAAQRVWVRELSFMFQQPADIAATMSFAAMATCLQRTHEIQVTRDWNEEVSVYMTAVAKSGSNKSQIQDAATRAMAEHERQSRQSHARQLAEYKVRRGDAEDELKRAANDDVEARIELQFRLDELDRNAPHEPQILASDATQEGLIPVLKHQNGSIGLHTPEGKEIYSQILGRYSGRSNDIKIELFLLGWGESYCGNRASKDNQYVRIDNIRITIGNSMQPEYVEQMMAHPELFFSGFMGRFLISYPRSTMGWRDTAIRPMREGVQDAYDQTLATVLRGTRPAVGLHVISVSDEGVRELEAYKSSFEAFLREGARYEGMTSWMSKSCGFVVKLAALMQAFERPNSAHAEPLSLDLIKRAITITNYYREHYLRLVLKAQGDGYEIAAQKLVDWLRRKKLSTFTARDVRQHVRALKKDRVALGDALETLQESNFIRAATTTTSGKKPRRIYVVNPAVFESIAEAPNTLPVRTEEPPPNVDLSPARESLKSANAPNTPSDSADPLGGVDPTDPSVYESRDTCTPVESTTPTSTRPPTPWRWADCACVIEDGVYTIIATLRGSGEEQWIPYDEPIDIAKPGDKWTGSVRLDDEGLIDWVYRWPNDLTANGFPTAEIRVGPPVK